MQTSRLPAAAVEAAQLVQTQLQQLAVTAAQVFRIHTVEPQLFMVVAVVAERELAQTVLQVQAVRVAAETAEDNQVEVQELQTEAAVVVVQVAKMLVVQVVLAL
jgi:hypothetical protein